MVCDHETLLDVIGFRQRGKTGICAGPTEKFILVADDQIALPVPIAKLEMAGETLEVMITKG